MGTQLIFALTRHPLQEAMVMDHVISTRVRVALGVGEVCGSHSDTWAADYTDVTVTVACLRVAAAMIRA